MINNYYYQSSANIQCFMQDTEYSERKEALFTLCEMFQENNIRWGLACSANLFLRGIVDDFHDLDFIVEKDDCPRVRELMEGKGAILKETGGNGFCESDTYMHYQLGRVDVDIISGFKIVTFGTYYKYSFNPEEIEFVNIGKIKLSFISMEALYILYAMMEGWQARRRYKRILIEEYLLQEEIKFPQILEDAQKSKLPGWIKNNIYSILNK